MAMINLRRCIALLPDHILLIDETPARSRLAPPREWPLSENAGRHQYRIEAPKALALRRTQWKAQPFVVGYLTEDALSKQASTPLRLAPPNR